MTGDASTERPSRKRLWIWLGAAGALLIAGIVTVTTLLWDRGTPVSAEDVTVTMSVVAGGGQPGDYGLYRYVTTGLETADALGGARHDFPLETCLTLQPGGCGTLVRWHAFAQRWTEWDYCDDGLLAGWLSYHEWFGVGNLDQFTYPEPFRTTGEVGEQWSVTCGKEGSLETMHHEVIGLETLMIGGTEVEVLHVRRWTDVAGETFGTNRVDIWTLPGTPLIARRAQDGTTTSQSPIGDVEYHEECELQLKSPFPDT